MSDNCAFALGKQQKNVYILYKFARDTHSVFVLNLASCSQRKVHKMYVLYATVVSHHRNWQLFVSSKIVQWNDQFENWSVVFAKLFSPTCKKNGAIYRSSDLAKNNIVELLHVPQSTKNSYTEIYLSH